MKTRQNFRLLIIITTIIALGNCLKVNGQEKNVTSELRTKYAGWVELNEGETIDDYFRKNNQIYCGQVKCNVKPLEGIDIETFKVFPGSKYAKDKNQVYYPIHLECAKHKNCTVCYCEKFIVQHADAESFAYLGKDYAMDKHTAFYKGKKIEGSDPATFRVMEGPKFFYFAVDANHVYIHNKVFKDADPKTFYFDSTAPESNELIKQSLIGDKTNRWIFTPPFHVKLLAK